MQPDAHTAMHRALVHGPSHLPGNLFAGSDVRVMMGMKAHANSISHARFVALEETYPRTHLLIGPEAFHRIAETHLKNPERLREPLATIGRDLALLLNGPMRDLARLEWAWLEAHGAADAPPFDLHAIADFSAEQVAGAMIRLHPAARLVPVHHSLYFDETAVRPPLVMLTRVDGDVRLTVTTPQAARLFAIARTGCTIAALLEADADRTTQMVSSGALTLSPETL